MKKFNDPGLISVIMPTYNYGSYILEAIKSVQNQTYAHWECVIVDDGSTDNTKEIITSICQTDQRIRYFCQNNQGTSAAKNYGLSLARGEFIQFLDADDILECEKFEHQISFLSENKSYDLVYGTSVFFSNENTNLSGLSKQFDNTPWAEPLSGDMSALLLHLLKKNFLTISAPIFRMDKQVLFDENLAAMEDWKYWINYFQLHSRVKYSDHKYTAVCIRVHSDSASANYAKMLKNELLMRNELKFSVELLQEINSRYFSSCKEKYEGALKELGFNNLQNGSLLNGFRQIFEAMNLSKRYLYYTRNSLYWLNRRFL